MTVPLRQAQADLAALVDRVERGESVTIEREGIPVARLVGPERDAAPRTFGVWAGRWEPSDEAFSPEAERDAERLFYGE
ncbi:MAG: type II toxin-antitoxin system prevent-host-death family antitoxin [Bacteroidota bacterium]